MAGKLDARFWRALQRHDLAQAHPPSPSPSLPLSQFPPISLSLPLSPSPSPAYMGFYPQTDGLTATQAAKLLGEGASLEAQDDLDGMRALHKVAPSL